MDAKYQYSSRVASMKDRAKNDPNSELAKYLRSAERRKNDYRSNWTSVDLNEVVDRLTPGAIPEISNGKITFTNKEGTIKIVADAAGGYLRIQDLTSKSKKEQYVGLDGRDAHNYRNERGKQQGRSRAEFNKATHFRIKKREEM
ncbi:MAG: hypothetical protein IJM30_01735 [Thermoguttaceae bacterium]|nr:hypothetical protein [Thermoguttaceae bacterium]